SIDGFTGEVFSGRIDTVDPDLSANRELPQLLAWADELRRLGVLGNADTPEEAQQALAFGAQGIGLCRTEHMFFHHERLPYVREMLLRARDASRLEREVEEARAALSETTGDALIAAEERLRTSPDARAFTVALDRLG